MSLSPVSPPTFVPHPYKVQVAQELPCYENPWKPLQYLQLRSNQGMSGVAPNIWCQTWTWSTRSTPCHKLVHYKLLAQLLYYCTMGHDRVIMDDKWPIKLIKSSHVAWQLTLTTWGCIEDVLANSWGLPLWLGHALSDCFTLSRSGLNISLIVPLLCAPRPMPKRRWCDHIQSFLKWWCHNYHKLDALYNPI
jgi:hypothetical protein